MRRIAGYALAVLGVLTALAGAALAIAFGPDNQFVSGPHRLQSEGSAVVTAPDAIRYADIDVRLDVRGDPGSRVFVGMANDVDVQSYLGDVAYTRLDSVSVPWQTTSTEVDGTQDAAAPDRQDWWVASASGRGLARLTAPLPEGPVDVVVMNSDAAAGIDLTVSVAVVASGAFIGGLALVVAGLGLAVAGRVYAVRVGDQADANRDGGDGEDGDDGDDGGDSADGGGRHRDDTEDDEGEDAAGDTEGDETRESRTVTTKSRRRIRRRGSRS